MPQTITVPRDDRGEMDCLVSLPEAANGGAIVLAMSIWGLNQDLRETCDYYAALGYAVIAPNLFWRQSPGHGIDYDWDALPTAVGLMNQNNDQDGMADLTAARRALLDMQAAEKAAIVGWCYGGRIACLFGPEMTFDAVVGIYPTYMETRLDIAPAMKTPMDLHLSGIEQYGTTDDAVERIVSAFAHAADVRSYVYDGATHGFDFSPPHTAFNRAAARLTDSRTALFLQQRVIGRTLRN